MFHRLAGDKTLEPLFLFLSSFLSFLSYGTFFFVRLEKKRVDCHVLFPHTLKRGPLT